MEKRTILVIDDQQSICMLLSAVLKNDYNLVIANDGFDAMVWLSDGNKPDLIITDIVMPNFDGVKLIENLKKSTLFSTIPVIMLSSTDDEVVIEETMRYGAFDFLSKPFDPVKLRAMVKKALTDVTID